MILDDRTEFLDATALNTGPAGTYLIGDVIDLEDVRDIGQGQPVYLVISMDTAVGSTADGVTVAFTLASDAQAAIATDGSATVHLTTGALAQADLGGGAQFVYTLPIEGPAYERYLGILQTTGVEAATAGAVSAGLTADPHGWKAYADAVN